MPKVFTILHPALPLFLFLCPSPAVSLPLRWLRDTPHTLTICLHGLVHACRALDMCVTFHSLRMLHQSTLGFTLQDHGYALENAPECLCLRYCVPSHILVCNNARCTHIWPDFCFCVIYRSGSLQPRVRKCIRAYFGRSPSRQSKSQHLPGRSD